MLHAVKPQTNVTVSVQVRGSRPSVVLPPAEPTRRIPPLLGAWAAGAAVAPPLTIAAETTPAAEARDKPVALFLDVDGTLLDFAEQPHEVVTPPGLVAALANAERKLEGALALVSGRAIDDLDRLFEPLRLCASGVHGAQMRFDPSEPATSSPGAVELPDSLWAALERTVNAFPGASAENKRFR